MTNKNKRSIIIIVNKIQISEQEKRPANIIQTGWRTSDIGQVFIHTHKFVDQNGREFDIAENYAFILLHIFDLLVK